LTWIYNGRELTSTSRIQLTFDKATTTLTITGATIEDTGEYVCQAKNALGEAATKTFLRVRRKCINLRNQSSESARIQLSTNPVIHDSELVSIDNNKQDLIQSRSFFEADRKRTASPVLCSKKLTML
jgi:Immunoglobulin I-set domain